MNQITQDIFSRVLLMECVPVGGSAAHLRWSAAGLAGRAVQVYVNGRLYDVIAGGAEAETWLHLDRSVDARVELLAVPAEQAFEDYGDELRGWAPAFVTEATIVMIRDESLPVDGRVVVTVDGVDDPGFPVWPVNVSRSGFGGLFGAGEFGRDAATGPGHGLCEFALGPFGAGGSAWRWREDEPAPGTHTVQVRVEDAAGRIAGEAGEPRQITIDSVPRAAQELTIDSTYTLRWK